MTEAYAQTTTVPNTTSAPAATAAEASPYGSLLPLLLIFVVFYFLLIRPQQKRVREHSLMVKNLRRGDKVVTGGGIIGTVVKVDEDALQVEIAPDVRVKLLPDSVTAVVNKTGDAEEKEPRAKKEPKSANDN